MPINDPQDFNRLIDFTQEVNQVDRQYDLFNDRIFNYQPSAHNSVAFDISKTTTTILPSVSRGARASTYNSDDNADTRHFGMLNYKHSDYITPEDIENVRLVGTPDGVKTLEQATAEKIEKMRRSMDQTEVYMQKHCVYNGKCVSASGEEVADMFTELGLTQTVFDMKLDVSTTDVLTKIRELNRLIRNSLTNGGFYRGVTVDLDPIMFDKLVSHESVKEAYKYFANNQNQPSGVQPLRDNFETFRHGNITFRSVDGQFNLPTGTTEKLIEDNTGHVIPEVDDFFRGYYGSSSKLSRVNGRGGVNMFYMWQYPDGKDESIEMTGEFSRLYIPTNPAALIKLTSTGA